MEGIISQKLVKKLQGSYVCAACWSPLVIGFSKEDRGKYTVECTFCGADTPGYVTSRYVERRVIQNQIEFTQAQEALENAYPFLFPSQPVPIQEPRTREKNLEQLGF